jgi:hypothetical protein
MPFPNTELSIIERACLIRACRAQAEQMRSELLTLSGRDARDTASQQAASTLQTELSILDNGLAVLWVQQTEAVSAVVK